METPTTPTIANLQLPRAEDDAALAPLLDAFDREVAIWRTGTMMRGSFEGFARLQFWSETLASLDLGSRPDLDLAEVLADTSDRSRYGSASQSLQSAADLARAARLQQAEVGPGRKGRPEDPEFIRELHYFAMGMAPESPRGCGAWRKGEIDIIDWRSGLVANSGERADRIEEAMGQFERIMAVEAWQNRHPLVRSGVGHLLFESIHPFNDGNGRLGRLLVDGWHLQQGLPPLPMSRVFEARRGEYLSRMTDALAVGEPGHYLEFHAEVAVQAIHHLRRNAKALETAVAKLDKALEASPVMSDPRARRNTAIDLATLPLAHPKEVAFNQRPTCTLREANSLLQTVVDAGLGKPQRVLGKSYVVITIALDALREEPTPIHKLMARRPEAPAPFRIDDALPRGAPANLNTER